MSTKVGRLTNSIHEEAMRNAFEAGFRKAQDFHGQDGPLDFDWDEHGPSDVMTLDPREDKEIKEKKKKSSGEDRPKKKSSPIKWVDDPELAHAPFDPALCSCRKWNGGFGAQCNREVDSDDLCSLHKNQYDKIIEEGGIDLPHGRFNQERPSHCLKQPDNDKEHAWKDLKKAFTII